MKKITLLFLLTLTSLSAIAETKTVTLEVPTMNCVTCPFTVKKALQNVEGVSKAEVTFDTKLAVVTFDNEKTTVKALTEATTNAGYPSTVKE
ncbi:mercury resistance system periplasmic binding protein MerP [Rheinheimera texasensis]|uniref:mercury resistance system periplasmic binding protein MerP n=1 Tax=Rheinheimera texasensis TaxID=306205 RepID=UPI002AD71894|nr:mercury resistance system periplasmic binding protein MerP [Rheinheimera sp.]